MNEAQANRDLALDTVLRNERAEWRGRWYQLLAQVHPFTGTGEALRYLFLKLGLPNPHHPNAWGAQVNAAIKRGYLEKTGLREQMIDPKSNARETDILRTKENSMGRPPKNRAAAKKEPNPATANLLAALKFLEPAASEIGAPNQTHCQIANKTVVLFNGTIALGILIDTDIIANPHLLLLIAALTRCREETQITQLAENRLAIKSGKFKAFINCLDSSFLAPVYPDPLIAPMDDRIRVSMDTVGRIAKENADRMLLASVMLRSGSAVATDGVIMFEHWHGIDMPPVVVPKVAVTMLLKINKKIIGFGVNQDKITGAYTSLTIWFEDNSWFRTQLYIEPFPSTLDNVLNTPSKPWPVPAGLWDALEALASFTDETKRVYLDTKTVSTHRDKDIGASYEIEGALPKLILNRDLLAMFSPFATTIDFNATDNLVTFFGENFRGMLSKIKDNTAASGKSPDDDIPF